jgi:hypothetical protein
LRISLLGGVVLSTESPNISSGGKRNNAATGHAVTQILEVGRWQIADTAKGCHLLFGYGGLWLLLHHGLLSHCLLAHLGALLGLSGQSHAG